MRITRVRDGGHEIALVVGDDVIDTPVRCSLDRAHSTGLPHVISAGDFPQPVSQRKNGGMSINLNARQPCSIALDAVMHRLPRGAAHTQEGAVRRGGREGNGPAPRACRLFAGAKAHHGQLQSGLGRPRQLSER